MQRSTQNRIVRVFLVASVSSGCGPGVNAEDEEVCADRLGAVVLDHACQHGSLGPFSTVEAGSAAGGVLPSLDVRQHVVDLTLGESDRSREQTFYLTYTPSRDGEHAVFTGWQDRDIPLRIFEGDAEMPATHRQRIETAADDCGEMTRIVVFELTRNVSYRVELGPTRESQTRLFFEHPPTFGVDAWELSCEPQ